MELNDKVTELEDEIKILKNEVQAVLLDLRESYLNNENPFSPAMNPMASQPIIITQPAPVPAEPPPTADSLTDIDSEDTGQGDLTEVETVVDIPAAEPEILDLENDLEDDVSTDEPASPADYPDSEEMADEPEMKAGEETAQGEGSRAWRPQIGNTAPFMPGGTNSSGGKIDLDNITKLAQWVEGAVIKLGPERTEAALDISEMMGHINPELKNILVKFISPVPEGPINKVSTRDYLASLIELTGLLGRDNRSEVALLYILCQENDHR